jgi:hypothetical protein
MRPNQGNRPIQEDQKIVRFGKKACSSGYCDELGLLLRETTMSYVYRMRGGGEAAIPKRLAHCEPCPHCANHRELEPAGDCLRWGAKAMRDG